jgi:hypothetical protein
MVAELVSPLTLPYPHHQSELSRTVPARPSNAELAGGRVSSPALMPSGGVGLTSTIPSRASSTVLPSQGMGPTLPSAATGELLSQLSLTHASMYKKVRKRHWVPWNWIYRWLSNTIWVLGTKPGSSAKAVVLISLSHLCSLPTHFLDEELVSPTWFPF